jgi:hypothetical protein
MRVNVTVTSTVRVPLGTVPEVDSSKSAVVEARSAVVTGPMLADPSSPAAPSRNSASTMTLSLWIK